MTSYEEYLNLIRQQNQAWEDEVQDLCDLALKIYEEIAELSEKELSESLNPMMLIQEAKRSGRNHFAVVAELQVKIDELNDILDKVAHEQGSQGSSGEPHPTHGEGGERPEPDDTVLAYAGSLMDSVTRHGITWTFDKQYQVGKFANGDPWVIGPVSITKIDPAPTSLPRVMHGSMVNPDPRAGITQGFDSAWGGKYVTRGMYSPELNVARNISRSPLLLQPHNSLMSVESKSQPEQRPQFLTAAVLTVVDTVPASGSFRPAYSGRDKTIKFNESDLDYSLLQQLTIPTGAPSLQQAYRWVERVWPDWIPSWLCDYLHPERNMENYGRDICDAVSRISLLLHGNYSDADKRDLLVSFVQLGIDIHGTLINGGGNRYSSAAGHNNGRKWPVIFAGLMLNDTAMQGVGQDGTWFSEDGQTFIVQETSPGVYNYGYGGYDASHKGMAEWGVNHAMSQSINNPLEGDDVRWDPSEPLPPTLEPNANRSQGLKYRRCCTANVWWGQGLACLLMGAEALWNHSPYFAYLDRYRTVEDAYYQANGPSSAWTLAWGQDFTLTMWDQHRSNY